MYQPHQLSANTAATVAKRNNSSFGFAVGYSAEIPENLSIAVLMDSEIGKQQLRGGAVGSGYWFKEKEFVGPTFQTVNFWVYGVALKTAPCILLSVLSALLIRAMRAAEIRHQRLVRRRPVLSSFSASPRMDTQTCAVRRHHTFEEPKSPSQSELNGTMLGGSPAAWKRSFSERITRSTVRLAVGESIQLTKMTFSADAIQDNPATRRTSLESDSTFNCSRNSKQEAIQRVETSSKGAVSMIHP